MPRKYCPAGRGIAYGWKPLFAPPWAAQAGSAALRLPDATEGTPLSTIAIVVLAVLAAALAAALVAQRRRFAPLEDLIEEMEKVDLSRPGPVLPASIDGVGETEEVERLELAFLRMMNRLEAERRRAGSAALRAQEEERARVARDLHDEVNQSLTGLLLRLEAVREVAPPELAGRGRRDQGAREPGDARAARARPPAAADRARRPRPDRGDRGPGRADRAPRARGGARGRRGLLRPRRRRAAGRLPGRPGGAHQRRPPQRRRPDRGQPAPVRRRASSSRSPTTAAASPSSSPSAGSGSAGCASGRCWSAPS